ncbi:PREDICTED: dedicator of cytokinesis protein 4-like [Priapulus caudatus]|uniref:Dedicator of cytokinesis protein 4-like n=1 Tax=Priapulus caudatus TaxID=37621 RepID=A0ABM1EXT1_PRICU|nr:PREDICTED: dedicator of cytokinesis protein 4-like [Priapulus caudatus]
MVFLQDILDSLFSMFPTEESNKQDASVVFQALVFVFSLLEEEKFSHFRPVIDTYILNHFSAALTHKAMLQCMTELSNQVKSTDQQQPILRSYRCLEIIFRFIVQSRLLFSRATGGQEEEEFVQELRDLFSAFSSALCQTTDLITPTQSRLILMKMAVHHLRQQFEQKRELDLCADILASALKGLQREVNITKCKETVWFEVDLLVSPMVDSKVVPSLLDIIIQAIRTTDRKSATSGQLVAALIDILRLMDDNHYKQLWEQYADDLKTLREFLLKVFVVFQELVRGDVFPPDWMVMRMVTNSVILTSVQEFSQSLLNNFIEGDEFDFQLWSVFFSATVAFLTQPCLQMEAFSQQKRDKVTERYNDMRVLMGFQIWNMWSNLSEHKIRFIPGMVGPFLEVTLVPETELRKAILPIFFDMMDCEQRARGNFKEVESELIDKLDILVSENKGDDEYRELFKTM